MPLGPDTVFVVTGAAGSIVSAITADLAAASGGTFYLLDIAPEPEPNDPDLASLHDDPRFQAMVAVAEARIAGTAKPA